MAARNRREIQALLLELTEWRRMSGFDPSIDADSEFKSTGESNAAIEDLKRKLGRREHVTTGAKALVSIGWITSTRHQTA